MTIEEIMARDYRAAEAEAAAYERRAARAAFWYDLVRGILLAAVLMAFFGAVTWLAIAARERREAEHDAAAAEAVRIMQGGERVASQEARRGEFFAVSGGGRAMRTATKRADVRSARRPAAVRALAGVRLASAEAPRFRFFPALKA